jgi:hypothetical protein
MDGVSTMNLSDSGGDSMTPLFPSQPAPEQRLMQKSLQEKPNLVYKPDVDVENAPEKNNGKSKAMDSTPLSDIMQSEEYQVGPAGGGADPRFMMAPQPSYVQQQMPTPMGYQNTQGAQKQAAQSKNPMNLTDEQMEALLAGVVALVVSSGFTQEKLSTLVPKFLDEAGKRSLMGTLVVALLAAVLFYFGRRFVIRD